MNHALSQLSSFKDLSCTQARCKIGDTLAFSYSTMLQNVINEFLHKHFKGLQRHTCKMHETFKSLQTRSIHNDWIVSCYDFAQAMLQSWLINVAWMFIANYYLFKLDIDDLFSIRCKCQMLNLTRTNTHGNMPVQLDKIDERGSVGNKIRIG